MATQEIIEIDPNPKHEIVEMGSDENEEKDEQEKWIIHYSSNHQILLVGEGDLSFSLSLANAFGSASNICASALDSYDDLIKKYNKAKSNLENLKKLGAFLLHGVDATKMKIHTDLAKRKFDRIIFNFPHAGFYGKEDKYSMHRTLVRDFFRNARGMLRANGEIHVNHKNTPPFCHWNLEELACGNSLILVQRVNFNKEDYPGYQNKRGDGCRCDQPFPVGDSSTYKFRFSKRAKVFKATRSLGSTCKISQQSKNIPLMQLQPSSSDWNYDYPQSQRTSHHMNRIPLHQHDGFPSIILNRNHNSSSRALDFDANLNGMVQVHACGIGRHYYDVAYSVAGGMGTGLDVVGEMRHGLERQMMDMEVPRTLNGDLRQLHHISNNSNLRSSLQLQLKRGSASATLTCQAYDYEQNEYYTQEYWRQHW